jgi:GT2 family glycosyltransferase
MEYKISICIPTYEMAGSGESYLNHSLGIIAEQDHKNLEVIVSDHSTNEDIEKLCSKYLNLIDIKYVRNTKNIGSSTANLNNSIKYAT